MHTIAERLDLSVATVSRALRRVPGINPETRARVMQMAAQLDYKLPNAYRSEPMQSKKLHHIGVLIETPADQRPADNYIVGMSDAALSLNASLVIHFVTPEHSRRILDPKYQPRAMSAGLLSGLILVYRWPVEIVQELTKTTLAVSIAHKYPGVDIDVLGIDNMSGIELLMNRLYDFGHRKIGFFGRCGALYWSTVRFGAYVTTLTNLGLSYKPGWVVDVGLGPLTNLDSDWSASCAKARALAEDGVTAWVCASEPAGWELMTCLQAGGIRVPEDVSVVGFHAPDQPLSGKPLLTSVKASYEAIGAAALRRILYRVQNPLETTRTILFPCELQVGNSTAPISPATVS